MSKNLNTLLKTSLFLFVLLTVGCPASATGSVACHTVLRTTSSGFQGLPLATEIELPRAFIERIQKHPIMKLAARFHGEKPVFGNNYFTNDKSISGFTYGEIIQAQFVAETLKIIFPNAAFKDLRTVITDAIQARQQGKPVQKFIHLKIADPGESVTDPGTLPMPLLKAANPGLSAFRHGQFRKQLGFNSQDRIISLYAKDYTAAIEIVKQIDSTLRPDYIFVSIGGQSTSQADTTLFKGALQNRYDGLDLSQLSEYKKNPDRPAIILNDMKGKVPFIANVSDLVIISGPINMFEPLSAGAKTIVMTDPAVLGQYNADEFNRMLDRGIATGGVFPVPTTEDLKQRLVPIMNSQVHITPPYQAKGANQQASIDIYLDTLMKEILAEIEKNGI
jgi:hypothetical protein